MYMAGKLQSLGPNFEDLWRLLPPLVPLAGAVAVGITRIDDYWHFFTDVLAGAIIGESLMLCQGPSAPSGAYRGGRGRGNHKDR